MDEESEDNKPARNYGNSLTRKTFMSPEAMGKYKRKKAGIFDMSLDELIEYRKTGTMPKLVVRADKVHQLGRNGASLSTIADLFDTTEQSLLDNPEFYNAWKAGRADLATRNRMNLVANAETNMTVAIYLDKIIGGDAETSVINLNVSSKPDEVTQADSTALKAFLRNAKKKAIDVESKDIPKD